MNGYDCDSTDIFIRGKMEYSIQGEYENICNIK